MRLARHAAATLLRLRSNPLGRARALLADTGYFSAANAEACEKAEIEPVIAENPAPVATMAHRLKVPEGRTLHALRKQTPEPVFGIIKTVPGLRQISMCGLNKARGERSRVTSA